VSEVSLDEQVAKTIASLLLPLDELDQKLATREAQLNEELDELRGERRKLRALLRVADPNAPKMGPKPKEKEKNAHSTQWSISEEIVARVGAAATQIEDEWRHGQVAKLASTTPDMVRRACRVMRERGQIRLVRGGGTGVPLVYVVTPKGKAELTPEIPVNANGS
jgi:hypothetical protein